jgi:hypothetical protein
MLYNPNLTDGATAPYLLAGRSLAGNLPAHRRAFQAADLILGKAYLVEPTAAQAAALCRVSPAYAFAAKRIAYCRPDLRADTEAGCRPMLPTAYGKPSPDEVLLKIWRDCSPGERIAFCRGADPEAVFAVIEAAIGMSDAA